MKLGYVLHFYDEDRSPQEMVRAHYSSYWQYKALLRLGVELCVFYRYHSEEIFEYEGVQCYFLKDDLPPYLKPHHRAKRYNEQVAEYVASLSIDLIHAHNQNRPIAHFDLQRRCVGTAYVVQDHGGYAYIKMPRWQRYFLKGIDRLLVAAEGMEEGLLQHRIIPKEKIRYVMEASSEFEYNQAARGSLEGSPVFLFVGNLKANKDPLTVLKAWAQVSDKGDSHLHFVYKETDLEAQLNQLIADYSLEGNVHMHGFVPRERMADLLSAADYIISASHKEGSGYAIMEAMSVGCEPMVTDIPSFRTLTGKGEIGTLYPPRDVHRLAAIINGKLAQHSLDRETVSTFFTRHFSYDIIATRLLEIYHDALRQKHGNHETK